MKPVPLTLATLVAVCALPGAGGAQTCTITRQVYEGVRMQSARDQVEAVIGCRGQVINEGPGLTGGRLVTITFPGRRPGSLARFSFDNDKLITKGENGLE